jgi:hypothetical protein
VKGAESAMNNTIGWISFLPCFVFEADLGHDFKELIEQPLAEIDDRRAAVIAENAIK